MGLFVGLLVGISAVDQYLLTEHDPMEPEGLIWRVQTSFSRIEDLEVVLEVVEGGNEDHPIRMLVRFLNTPDSALSLRYLSPESLRDELFTIERDLLSHYLPEEDVVIVRRWIGFPLSDLGTSIFKLLGLEKQWRSGQLDLRVIRDTSGFGSDLFPTSILISETISGCFCQQAFSICTGPSDDSISLPGFAGSSGALPTGSIQGGYILEVTDTRTDQLSRMIWVDREDYMVRKVVFFSEGKRTTSIRVERMTTDQGLTVEEVLLLPHGVEVIRG